MIVVKWSTSPLGISDSLANSIVDGALTQHKRGQTVEFETTNSLVIEILAGHVKDGTIESFWFHAPKGKVEVTFDNVKETGFPTYFREIRKGNYGYQYDGAIN